MNNDDGMNNEGGGGQNDYGDEGFDPNMQDGNVEGDMEGGNAGPGGEDAEVDQYFEDAGDIGYLPADHVTSSS
jgi:hypothetical protein